jgi:transposase-like protein
MEKTEKAILNRPEFKDETKARQWLESIRWPDGPVCPHCGSVSSDHYKLEGKAHRPGVYKCKDCREQFTVTVGTVFERSKIKLNVWLQAMHLMTSSKKGVSSKQLERMLGVTYQTAWFMSHRIREAMKPGKGGLLGGSGSIVEADETFVGNKPNRGKKPRGGFAHKHAVFSLVERSGNVRSFHVPNVTAATLGPIIKEHMSNKSFLMTDDAGQYRILGPVSVGHDTVHHMHKEYVRGNVHTNTVEGFFSIFKRGIYGVYHHVSEQHLHRYTSEFDFRYNYRERRVKIDGRWEKIGYNDEERTIAVAKGISGKRLTYRRINGAAKEAV